MFTQGWRTGLVCFVKKIYLTVKKTGFKECFCESRIKAPILRKDAQIKMSFEKRKLGQTDIEVTPIGLGVMQFADGEGFFGKVLPVHTQLLN